MMNKIVILGAGIVGRAIAIDKYFLIPSFRIRESSIVIRNKNGRI